ncbi:hypothetical protein ACFLW9_03305 [Chloroflexota bacterium]
MDIFDKIIRAGEKAIAEFNKPETHVKGDDFENYVEDYMFFKDNYKLVHRTQDYSANKNRFIEESKEPDFKFKSIKTGKEFFVEAKYRSRFHNDAVEWCTFPQLKRYQEIDRKTPVYLALGIGGNAYKPDYVFCIPLKDIKYTKLFRSFLKKYEASVDSPIDHRLLK